MDAGIWKVKMGDKASRTVVGTIYNVKAKSMAEAIAKAEKLEKEWVDDVNESEGESFKPSVPIAVEYICDLHG